MVKVSVSQCDAFSKIMHYFFADRIHRFKIRYGFITSKHKIIIIILLFVYKYSALHMKNNIIFVNKINTMYCTFVVVCLY